MRTHNGRMFYWLQVGRVEFYLWKFKSRHWGIDNSRWLLVIDMGRLTIDIYKYKRDTR